jgi:hypothetical protein
MCRVDSDRTIGCYCPPLYPNGDPKIECKSLEILFFNFSIPFFQIISTACVHQLIYAKFSCLLIFVNNFKIHFAHF